MRSVWAAGRIRDRAPHPMTAPVLQVLVDKFNIMPISTVEEDLKAILG